MSCSLYLPTFSGEEYEAARTRDRTRKSCVLVMVDWHTVMRYICVCVRLLSIFHNGWSTVLSILFKQKLLNELLHNFICNIIISFSFVLFIFIKLSEIHSFCYMYLIHYENIFFYCAECRVILLVQVVRVRPLCWCLQA